MLLCILVSGRLIFLFYGIILSSHGNLSKYVLVIGMLLQEWWFLGGKYPNPAVIHLFCQRTAPCWCTLIGLEENPSAFSAGSLDGMELWELARSCPVGSVLPLLKGLLPLLRAAWLLELSVQMKNYSIVLPRHQDETTETLFYWGSFSWTFGFLSRSQHAFESPVAMVWSVDTWIKSG